MNLTKVYCNDCKFKVWVGVECKILPMERENQYKKYKERVYCSERNYNNECSLFSPNLKWILFGGDSE